MRLHLIGLAWFFWILSEAGFSYSANKVWFETLDSGLYRVYVNYTVPALKEFREAYVDFPDKSKAAKFYWDLVRGADFHVPKAATEFAKPPMKPSPW